MTGLIIIVLDFFLFMGLFFWISNVQKDVKEIARYLKETN